MCSYAQANGGFQEQGKGVTMTLYGFAHQTSCILKNEESDVACSLLHQWSKNQKLKNEKYDLKNYIYVI